jgi:hypothetical protein
MFITHQVLQRIECVHTCAAFQFLDAEYVYGLVFELVQTDLLKDISTNGPYGPHKVSIVFPCANLGACVLHT